MNYIIILFLQTSNKNTLKIYHVKYLDILSIHKHYVKAIVINSVKYK